MGGFERQRVMKDVRARLFGVQEEPVRIDRYELVDRIDAGATSVVYRARDPKLDRTVALKVLFRVDATVADKWRRRILREAQAMARLAHPNVVGVHDVGEHEGQLYIAMEHVQGQNLRQWLSEQPTKEAVLDVFRDIASAIQAMHDASVVHRDLKPENILIGIDGRVRVADFGVALTEDDVREGPPSAHEPATARLTQTGAAIGTVAYMAPEQLLGGPVDHRADQFSFCVTLFEAIQGARPHEALPVNEMRRWFEMQPAWQPPVDEMSEPVASVLRRGLRVSPDDRFTSMRELGRALAAPASPRARTKVLMAGAAAALSLGAIAMVALQQRNATPASTRPSASSPTEAKASAPPPSASYSSLVEPTKTVAALIDHAAELSRFAMKLQIYEQHAVLEVLQDKKVIRFLHPGQQREELGVERTRPKTFDLSSMDRLTAAAVVTDARQRLGGVDYVILRHCTLVVCSRHDLGHAPAWIAYRGDDYAVYAQDGSFRAQRAPKID